jgi:hypothetical protein
MKLWKLLPAVVLAAGAAAVPAVASASPAVPAGVTISGPTFTNAPPSLTASLPNPGGDDLSDETNAGIVSTPNWAGYVDLYPYADGLPSTFTYVGTTFTVPVLTAEEKYHCVLSANEDKTGVAMASYWAGLGGFGLAPAPANKHRPIAQEGVLTECKRGSIFVYTYGWWEMYPGPLHVLEGINPGDLIVVSTTYTGGKYKLYVHDDTNGKTDSNVLPQSCPTGSDVLPCSRGTAEVITEDPGVNAAGGEWLADYGRVGYTGSFARDAANPPGAGVVGTLGNGHGDWANYPLYQQGPDGPGNVMQSVSGLNSAGTAFSTTFGAPY